MYGPLFIEVGCIGYIGLGCTGQGQENMSFPLLTKELIEGKRLKIPLLTSERLTGIILEKTRDNYTKRSLKKQEDGMESKTKLKRLNLD